MEKYNDRAERPTDVRAVVDKFFQDNQDIKEWVGLENPRDDNSDRAIYKIDNVGEALAYFEMCYEYTRTFGGWDKFNLMVGVSTSRLFLLTFNHRQREFVIQPLRRVGDGEYHRPIFSD